MDREVLDFCESIWSSKSDPSIAPCTAYIKNLGQKYVEKYASQFYRRIEKAMGWK